MEVDYAKLEAVMLSEMARASLDMYEALREARDVLDALAASKEAMEVFPNSAFVGPALRNVKSAIAKAEGE